MLHRLCATDDVSDGVRARARPRARHAATGAALLVALAVSCRIYREDEASPEIPAVEAARPTTGAAPAARRDSDEGLNASASDALNLWVLNRPKDDLAPLTSERVESVSDPRAVEQPRATVLVALGLGEWGADCAEQLAIREVAALRAGTDPLLVVTRVIDTARQIRWASGSGELSAIVKGPRAVLGGVEKVPHRALEASLRRALERRAVLDGQHPRWREVAAEPRPAARLLAACESATAVELAGPSGVLVRTTAGQFFGGVVGLVPPADAGVVSLAAQYGVSLAVGAAGAVLLASDCPVPPDERFAARVYASQSWTQAAASIAPTSDCRAANALATRTRAWATAGGDLVWSAAEANPAPPARSVSAADAGAPPPEPSPP